MVGELVYTDYANDLVTIVTVTYNAGDFLEQTFLSVINQNYKNIEYIIIDGGSTDNTIDIIKRYEDHLDYWISEPDDGIYFAMNKAIEKATGKWINFMNAGDTFFDLNTVAYVMEHKENDAEMIYGNVQMKKAKTIYHAANKERWYLVMPFSHQTLFAKTKLMKQCLFDINYKLAADHHFIMKMYENNKRFNYIDRTIAIFDEGGFAQSNLFLSYIESIKVLLHSNASKEDIKNSWWFMNLKVQMSADVSLQLEKQNALIKEKDALIEKKETILLENISKLIQLRDSIKKLSSISFLFHPIEKFKSYKMLLKNYQR